MFAFPFVAGERIGLDWPQAPVTTGVFFSAAEPPPVDVSGGKSVDCSDTEGVYCDTFGPFLGELPLLRGKGELLPFDDDRGGEMGDMFRE